MKISMIDQSFNLTNLTNILPVFNYVVKSISGESRIFLNIFLTILVTFSIVGSITNLTVICIMKFIFNKRFNRLIQSKLTAASSFHIHRIKKSNIDNEEIIHQEPPRRDRKIEIYENYNYLKKKLIFNSNMIILYQLLTSLAVVDLFTCSIAIPVTVYEILNDMNINDYSCKIFEYFRSFGVISSNFIIILIAMERYILVYMGKDLNKKKFKYLFLFALFITLFSSFLLMLQVGIYQNIHGSIYYVGVCMTSNIIFDNYIKKFIFLFMTIFIIIGAICVTIVYILIFIRTFQIKKRRDSRKASELEILQNAIKHSFDAKHGGKFFNLTEKLKVKEVKSDFCINRNIRLAIVILFVAFIYYLSIIPWCLTVNNFINYDPYIHYSFLLNSFFNPLVYGLLNQNFRKISLFLIELLLFSICEKLRNLFRT